MQYRKLGKTGLNVSLVSLGSGGPSKLGQNTGLSGDDQDSLGRSCLELGINLIDSSEQYGESETILGRGLSGIRRDSYIMATKCAYKDADTGTLRTPEEIAFSVDGSLSRLGIDHIDIMQFHVLNSVDYFHVVDHLYPVLKREQEKGKIRFIGFSEQYVAEPDHRVVVLALKTHPEIWDTVMLKYGILNQFAAREALPLAMEHNIGIINMAVIREKLPNPELLESQIKLWKQNGTISLDSVPDENPLGWLLHDDVDTIVDAGYKFAADHPAIHTVLTGTASLEHLKSNVKALESPVLDEHDKKRLNKIFKEVSEYI